MNQKKRVIFICTHNSSRSQMAEGLLRHLAGERYE
ncbi:arsenate reductase ArsC, partial [candidate division KSB1 bacterium]|nr:arsenate reductase ArsC [candidate division KSB1 bacterium]